MIWMENFFKTIANYLWGSWLLIVLVGLGIFYTVNTGAVQIRQIPYLFKILTKNLKGRKGQGRKGEGKDESISSVQALLTAVASCVGSGNIVGVSTAVIAGGPGALFWMWVAAFFGMATKFGEIVLGICYRQKDGNNRYIGGPMYYIARAFRSPWMGGIAAVLLFVQNAGATLIQSNTLAAAAQSFGNIAPLFTGIVIALVLLLIIKGGLKRLVTVAEKIVPLMAGLYLAGSLVVILAHMGQIPAMFQEIFTQAFSWEAGTGAAMGVTMRQAMRYGIARGLYSNEAGEGTAAVFHSSVDVVHPVQQGIYGILEVFIDTMLICSATGFVIIITGAYQVETNPINLVAGAFASVAPFLQIVVYISLILFSFTSLMGQWYFGHVSLMYLKLPGLSKFYRFLFPIIVIVGSISTVNLVWYIQDCALALLIIPNIIAMVLLSKEVRKLTKEFFDPSSGYIEN